MYIKQVGRENESDLLKHFYVLSKGVILLFTPTAFVI